MPDIDHTYGEDISVSANGDILLADSVTLSEEMVLRRLLTNPQDYIWQPNYGAGLPQKVGDPFSVEAINAIVTGQMFLEQSVQRDPAPTVDVQSFPNGMFVEISYTEADTGFPAFLNFPISPQGSNG